MRVGIMIGKIVLRLKNSVDLICIRNTKHSAHLVNMGEDIMFAFRRGIVNWWLDASAHRGGPRGRSRSRTRGTRWSAAGDCGYVGGLRCDWADVGGCVGGRGVRERGCRIPHYGGMWKGEWMGMSGGGRERERILETLRERGLYRHARGCV